MAGRLQERKVANIVAVDPAFVATANPGCALQVAAGIRKAGRAIEVKHIVELLDEAYAAYKPTSRASSARAASTLA
jgi:glycolate oxidase iron-sulfur subunit